MKKYTTAFINNAHKIASLLPPIYREANRGIPWLPTFYVGRSCRRVTVAKPTIRTYRLKGREVQSALFWNMCLVNGEDLEIKLLAWENICKGLYAEMITIPVISHHAAMTLRPGYVSPFASAVRRQQQNQDEDLKEVQGVDIDFESMKRLIEYECRKEVTASKEGLLYFIRLVEKINDMKTQIPYDDIMEASKFVRYLYSGLIMGAYNGRIHRLVV